MAQASASRNFDPWGEPPWAATYSVAPAQRPEQADFVIVGAGFSGLAAAAHLARLVPKASIAVFEAETIGAGASGRTGAVVMDGTAAGEAAELGEVLEGLRSVLDSLGVDAALELGGVCEIGREDVRSDSVISWDDYGKLGIVEEVAGGSLDPGKLLDGLARAAQAAGVKIFEHTPVRRLAGFNPPLLELEGGKVRASRVLWATNAYELGLSGLEGETLPYLTLAVTTEALSESTLAKLGLAARKPFYTVDLPYLWGRVLKNNEVIFGCGLVPLDDASQRPRTNLQEGEAAAQFDSLTARVRGLHPVLRDVRFTRRWGGPILISSDWQPILRYHPECRNVLVLGGYSGHGVALSVYLGAWAAEALAGRKPLPHIGA